MKYHKYELKCKECGRKYGADKLGGNGKCPICCYRRNNFKVRTPEKEESVII